MENKSFKQQLHDIAHRGVVHDLKEGWREQETKMYIEVRW